MKLTRLSILFLTILSSTNSYSQVCSNEYLPETEFSSKDEVMEKATEIFSEDPTKSEIEEQYRSAAENKVNEMEFEPSEALSPEEMSSLEIGETSASVADPANIVGAMVYSAIDSYVAYTDPNASDLDRVTAETEWIPGLGFLMSMIDSGVNTKKYNQEMKKHQAQARGKAENLNNLMHYDSSPEEQNTLDKLKSSMIDALIDSRRHLIDDFLDDLKKFYKESYLQDASAVLASNDKHFANKIIAESTDFIELVDFLKKTLIEADTETPSLISSATATRCGITKNPTTGSSSNQFIPIDTIIGGATDYTGSIGGINDVSGGISGGLNGDTTTPQITFSGISSGTIERSTTESSGNFLEGKDLQQVAGCFEAIFDDYKTTLDYRSSENWMYSLIDSFEKARNHFLAHIKLSKMNDFYKVTHSEENTRKMCDIYKTHATGYLGEKEILLNEIGKLEFFQTNNLDSEGRSKDPWCWDADVVHCKATSSDVMVDCDFDNNWCRGMTDNEKFDSQKACYKYHEARGKFDPPVCDGAFRTICMYGPTYVDGFQWCGQYCTYSDVYKEDECGIVDYHPDRDRYLKKVKHTLFEAKEEEYNRCLSSRSETDTAHVNLGKAIDEVDLFRETDREQLFEILFKQVKIEILNELIAYLGHPKYAWSETQPTDDAVKVFGTATSKDEDLTGKYPICRSNSDYQSVGFVKDDLCYVRSYYNRDLYKVSSFRYLWKIKGDDNWITYDHDDGFGDEDPFPITDSNQIYNDTFYLCRANNQYRTIGYINSNNKCVVAGYRNDMEYWESDFSFLAE